METITQNIMERVANGHVWLGDCESLPMADDGVDLVFGSPPYEAARTYGIGFNLKGDAWVEWAADRFMEHLRVCKGLVAWVVEGQTRQFRYSCAPVLLMAELHRRGVKLRKPPVFHRVGIPGSGGPDWLRNDWEFIVCGTKHGKLPWSDNTAMGHTPKYASGGACTNQTKDGRVRDAFGFSGHGGRGRHANGDRKKPRPIQATRGTNNGDAKTEAKYAHPKKANPGNVIKCLVGGGVMGSKLAHENEAPFPEALAEFFVRSFCPPNGIVLDPFTGSGTTPAAAEKAGRRWIGVDIRESQIELTKRRVAEATAHLERTAKK